MRRFIWTAGICAFLIVSSQSAALSQWETYSSEENNISFQIPSGWKTVSGDLDGVPELVAESAEGTMAMYVYSYKDVTISTQELFDQTVDDLDFKSKGDSWEENTTI